MYILEMFAVYKYSFNETYKINFITWKWWEISTLPLKMVIMTTQNQETRQKILSQTVSFWEIKVPNTSELVTLN